MAHQKYSKQTQQGDISKNNLPNDSWVGSIKKSILVVVNMSAKCSIVSNCIVIFVK